MTAGGGDRDWSELPYDLLGCIAERLSVSDYLRFGSVCNSWASVAAFPQAPQKPYLLHVLSEGDGILVVSFPDHRNQHRIATGGAVDLRGKWPVGSQYGWLSLLDERSEVSLLNPLTRDQIRLPSVTTLPLLTPIHDSDSDRISGYHFSHSGMDDLYYSYTFEEFRFISFKKVVLSSRPNKAAATGGGRGFTAMAIFSGYTKPAIARPGEDRWIFMRDWPPLTDVIYRNGKFLGTSNEGNLLAFDVTPTSLEATKIAEGWDYNYCGDKYLVDSDGDLLMVWRRTCGGKTNAITVMKFAAEQGAWLPFKSLGDKSLFLGLCCSISLSVRDIPDLKPNCVYYTEVLWDWLLETEEEMQMPREVWVFNLEDETFDHYAPADHRLYWPPPIWITPSLL